MAVNEWEWLKENPMKRITKPKEARGRDRFLSINEKHRLIEACHASSNPYLYPIVALALEMGMRFGEIIKLRWKDINFERELIILRETKNGEDRIRKKYYQEQLKIIENFTILDPGPGLEHSFCIDCYQKVIESLIGDYRNPPTPINIENALACATN